MVKIVHPLIYEQLSKMITVGKSNTIVRKVKRTFFSSLFQSKQVFPRLT